LDLLLNTNQKGECTNGSKYKSRYEAVLICLTDTASVMTQIHVYILTRGLTTCGPFTVTVAKPALHAILEHQKFLGAHVPS